MSTQPTPTKKRGRPPVKTGKVRPSISMDPGILKKARKMAFSDGLAFSTWIEQMVRERIQSAPGYIEASAQEGAAK